MMVVMMITSRDMMKNGLNGERDGVCKRHRDLSFGLNFTHPSLPRFWGCCNKDFCANNAFRFC